jgi:hypothetical protein
MSVHNNPITNVTTKSRVTKLKLVPTVIRKKELEDSFSFLEMSIRRISKKLKQ